MTNLKLYVCLDSAGDTAFVVAEDQYNDRSRIVDWNLNEEEVAALVRMANAGALDGNVGAEYCDDWLTYPDLLEIEEDGSYETDNGNRSRCSWVAGERTVRDSFSYWGEAECPASVPICTINLNDGDGRQTIFLRDDGELCTDADGNDSEECDLSAPCWTVDEARETAVALWGGEGGWPWGLEWITTED